MTNLAEVLVEQSPPWRAPRPNEAQMLTLYERPADWPMFYVIRACYFGGAKVVASSRNAVFRSEQDAVRWINKYYPHATFMGKSTDDEPQILGVWL